MLALVTLPLSEKSATFVIQLKTNKSSLSYHVPPTAYNKHIVSTNYSFWASWKWPQSVAEFCFFYYL